MLDGVNCIQWGQKIVRRIEIHPILGSTNDFGKERAKSGGVSSGTVFWALVQTSGRGRRGRGWASDGGSLTFSLVWRCPPGDLPPALTLAVGLGLAVELAPLVPGLKVKWPNDLWVQNKKLGGVLAETVRRKGDLWLILGVGLNVNSTPDGHLGPRTSLEEVAGHSWPRLGILHHALEGLEKGLEFAYGGCDLAGLCLEYGNFLGRPLTVFQGDRRFTAKVREVLPDGSLLLEDGQGVYAALPEEVSLVLD